MFFFLFIIMTTSVISPKTARDTEAFTYPLRAVMFLFIFLYLNFYPSLLTYQGGQELAEKTKGIVNPETVYFWKNNYSSSYCFATKTLRKEWAGANEQLNNTSAHLIYDVAYEKEISGAGLVLGEKVSVKDFEITKLDREFVNPKTRDAHCSTLVMARVLSFRKL